MLLLLSSYCFDVHGCTGFHCLIGCISTSLHGRDYDLLLLSLTGFLLCVIACFGCFSTSRFCMVERLPPVIGCRWCVLAGSWLAAFIFARLVSYVSVCMGMFLHAWMVMSLYG